MTTEHGENKVPALFSQNHVADVHSKSGEIRGLIMNTAVRVDADAAESEPTDLHWKGKQLAVGLFGRHRTCTIHLLIGGILRVTAEPEQRGSDRKGALKKGWDTVSGIHSTALEEGVEAECWVEQMAREAEVKPRKSKPQFKAVHLWFPPGMRELKARRARASAEDGTLIRVQLDEGIDAEETILTAVNSAFTRMAHNRVKMHKKVAALLELRHTAFNPHDAAHVEKMQGLWKLIRGDASPPPPLSRGEAADFRGTGMLSLHCLLYYAQHHSGMVASLVDAGRERTLSYPFAAACINIVNMLVQLLLDSGVEGGGTPVASSKTEVEGLRSPLFVILTRLNEAEAEHAVETLVCNALALLEQLWVRHSATYMLFNRILDGVRDCFRVFIADEWRAPSGSLNPLRDLDVARISLPEPPAGAPQLPVVPGPKVSEPLPSAAAE